MVTIPTSKDHKKYIDLNFDVPNTANLSQKTNIFDELCYSVFVTDNGKRLLDFFEAVYLKAPVLSLNHGTDYGFMREGQNALIRAIKNAIIRYEQESNKNDRINITS